MKFSLSYIFSSSPLIACAITDSDIDRLGDDFIKNADIAELRVDMFDDISAAHVTEIARVFKNRFSKPLLITARDIKEGGQREIADRVELYRAAAPLADIMDVEINSSVFSQIKELCSKNNIVLIASHHNFKTTPDNDFLQKIYEKGKSKGADIVKIAAFANSREDFLRLSMFTMKYKDEGIITMSMGDAGLPSRVLNPLFGSLITYGYINRPSAPGQLSIIELSDIFRKLKIR
jgi:3-dehydroquinate dehydratase type I